MLSPDPAQTVLILGLYVVLTFVASALYVRFAARNKLSDFLRDHFYLFAFAPLIFVFAALIWAIELSFTAIGQSTRWTFEKASGKRTRRRRTSMWG